MAVLIRNEGWICRAVLCSPRITDIREFFLNVFILVIRCTVAKIPFQFQSFYDIPFSVNQKGRVFTFGVVS